MAQAGNVSFDIASYPCHPIQGVDQQLRESEGNASEATILVHMSAGT